MDPTHPDGDWSVAVSDRSQNRKQPRCYSVKSLPSSLLVSLSLWPTREYCGQQRLVECMAACRVTASQQRGSAGDYPAASRHHDFVCTIHQVRTIWGYLHAQRPTFLVSTRALAKLVSRRSCGGGCTLMQRASHHRRGRKQRLEAYWRIAESRDSRRLRSTTPSQAAGKNKENGEWRRKTERLLYCGSISA